MNLVDIREQTEHGRLICRYGITEQGVLVEIKSGKVVSQLWIHEDGTYTIHTQTA